MIDRATVEKIVDAARIVDVVGEFVTLKKSGVNYKGLCPFHDDRNPSFMVSPSKNICHCFVCGKGGTPANFLMEHEQITYPEALRWLAKKYNIEIVEKELTDEERQEQNERESMFIVNEWAKDYFHNILLNDPDGLAIGKQYFRSRGIRDDIIEKFQLGYSPQKRDALFLASKEKGYKPEFLVKTGLCIENERGVYDRYSGRAIFPWFNISGKVVAFGGRVLDSRTKGVAQKYVNSPDSDIYHKERELYGLYQAKRAIVKEEMVYMVEGYTDVIAMHQAGIENVVANSGTALSKHQIHMLHRFTENITLLYDGDEAGIHAAMRGTDMLLAEGMKVRVLLLPDGDDPDSFARKHSTEELKKYINEHQTDFITFKSQLTVENQPDPIKRSEAIGGIVKSISVIPDQLLRDEFARRLSRRLNIKEETLFDEVNKNISKNVEEKKKEQEREEAKAERNTPEAEQPLTLHTSQEQASQIELMLVREIIRHGNDIIYKDVATEDGQTISLTVAQYIHYDLSQDSISFVNPLHNQILEEAVSQCENPDFKSELYFCSHPDLEISKLATQLAIDRHQLGGRFTLEEDEQNLRQRVLHLIMDYRLDIMENKLKEINQQLNQVQGNMERTMELLKEHMKIKELRDTLAKNLGSDLIIK